MKSHEELENSFIDVIFAYLLMAIFTVVALALYNNYPIVKQRPGGFIVEIVEQDMQLFKTDKHITQIVGYEKTN